MSRLQNNTITKDVRQLLDICSRRNRSLPFLHVPALSAEIRRLLHHADPQHERRDRMNYEEMIEDMISESLAAEMLLAGRSSSRGSPRWLKPSACRRAGEESGIYIPRYFQKMKDEPELRRMVSLANGGQNWRTLRTLQTRWALARRRELTAMKKDVAAMTRLRQLRKLMTAAVATLTD